MAEGLRRYLHDYRDASVGEDGDMFYEKLDDAGDVRNSPCRDLPAPAGGDHWGTKGAAGTYEYPAGTSNYAPH